MSISVDCWQRLHIHFLQWGRQDPCLCSHLYLVTQKDKTLIRLTQKHGFRRASSPALFSLCVLLGSWLDTSSRCPALRTSTGPTRDCCGFGCHQWRGLSHGPSTASDTSDSFQVQESAVHPWGQKDLGAPTLVPISPSSGCGETLQTQCLIQTSKPKTMVMGDGSESRALVCKHGLESKLSTRRKAGCGLTFQ